MWIIKKTILILTILAGMAFGQNIVVTGSWQETIDATDLLGPPGSDIKSDHPSGHYQIRIDISNAQGRNWFITIQRDGINWPSGLQFVAIRRTNGIGRGSISGGTRLTEVTETPIAFFRGNGDRSEIYIQVGIRNMSLNIPPAIYTLNVTYSITAY